MSFSAQQERRSWRQIQNLNAQTNEYIDQMTLQGSYSQYEVAKWNEKNPKNPRIYTTEPKCLLGGAGGGGKSHGIRACMVELHAVYLALGVEYPITAIIANSYPNLADWQIRELKRKYSEWGDVGEDHTFGIRFKFHDKKWGVCLLRNADKPDKRGGNILSAQIEEASLINWEYIEDIVYATRGAEAPFHSVGFVSNPDGPHAAQLKKLFVDCDFTGEPPDSWIREEDFHPIIRVFVWDNPVAKEADHRRLKGFKNEMLVRARYYGDWDILTGLRFARFSRQIHTFSWDEFCHGFGIPPFDDPAQYLKAENGFEIYASLDYGTSMDSATAVYLHAVDWKQRCWTFEEMWLVGHSLQEQVPLIAELLRKFHVKRLYHDPAIVGRDDVGRKITDLFREGFRNLKNDVVLIEGSRERIQRWAVVDELLHFAKNPDPPHEITSPPMLRILRPGAGAAGCPHLIKQFGEAPRHVTPQGNKLEDVDPMGGIWHGLDSGSFFWASYYRGGVLPKPPPEPGTNGWMRQRWEQHRQKRQDRLRW